MLSVITNYHVIGINIRSIPYLVDKSKLVTFSGQYILERHIQCSGNNGGLENGFLLSMTFRSNTLLHLQDPNFQTYETGYEFIEVG